MLLGLNKNVVAPALYPSKFTTLEGFVMHPVAFLKSPSNIVKNYFIFLSLNM